MKEALTFLLGFVSAARASPSSWKELRHAAFSKWGSDSKSLDGGRKKILVGVALKQSR